MEVGDLYYSSRTSSEHNPDGIEGLHGIMLLPMDRGKVLKSRVLSGLGFEAQNSVVQRVQ